MNVSRITKFAATGLFAGLAFVAIAGQANAGCKKGICVHGTDDDGVHNVYITGSYSGIVDHYNVRYPDGRQFEVSPDDTRFSFGVKSGRTYQFSVQACMNGGAFQKDTCSKWAVFTHTVD